MALVHFPYCLSMCKFGINTTCIYKAHVYQLSSIQYSRNSKHVCALYPKFLEGTYFYTGAFAYFCTKLMCIFVFDIEIDMIIDCHYTCVSCVRTVPIFSVSVCQKYMRRNFYFHNLMIIWVHGLHT